MQHTESNMHHHESPSKKEKNDSHEMHSHNKHAGHHTEDFLKRFWICLALTIPVLLLSHMIQQWLKIDFQFPGIDYVLLVLSSIVYLYGGMPFLKGMLSEIKHKAIGMMTLVAIAITVAYIYSVAIVFGLQGMDFFWELVTLIDIMLLGHWLEMRSTMAASKALESLVSLLPASAYVERNGEMININLKEIKLNEIVLIRPGEKVPADGIVIDGNSFVDESMLTGESVPVKKYSNDKVIAGSVNGSGSLKIKITAGNEENYLSKVIKLVQEAQNAKSATQNLADKVAKWLTIVSITTGVITFIVWYLNHDLSFALERMVTVMVTACPHALGVAIPLVVALSTTISASSGLLIKNRTAFEDARNITTIIFDKTGTLTKGSHEVKQVIVLDSQFSANEILQYSASLQQYSEHYIAKGILKTVQERELSLMETSGFTYRPGIGVFGNVNGRNTISAGPNYFKEQKLVVPEIPPAIDQDIETIIYIIIEDKFVGLITLSDSIRETSAEAIGILKSMNIKTYLLTGDNNKIASSVANKLNMDGFIANVLPHEKQEHIKEFQSKGEIVAMIGDGVNDAPALAQADVGIAVGSGTDVAAETADIILVNSDPIDVANAISFGRATYRKMIQNLVWASGYNIIAIPLAAGVLYPHFMLSPAMGAVLMSLSTVIVAINAKLLKLKRISR